MEFGNEVFELCAGPEEDCGREARRSLPTSRLPGTYPDDAHLDYFRIADHPLEIYSFMQRVAFRLPMLAVSSMRIHGRIVDLKNGKNVLTSGGVVGDNPLPPVSVQTPMGTLTHETAVSRAREIADRVLAPAAAQNDKAGRFSTEAVDALGRGALLGLMVSPEAGGSGLGPRTFATVTAALAEADASTAMVYLMHVLGAATIAAARPGADVAPALREIGAGRHLTTLAFSEAGSRSHFWTPISRARRNGSGVRITAKKSWVTSAGHAQSYIVSSLAPEGTGPTDSTLYLVPAGTPGLSVSGPWDGLGLRANASAPMILDDCEAPSGLQITEDGAGFQAMLNVVLPLFNLGTSAVALGLCRATVAATAAHLKNARFEHLGQSVGESLPTLRAQLATMQIDTDGLSARLDDLIDHLERPRETTLLRVLETKAAAGEIAISVTSCGMRTCGGAAFSKNMIIERLFRDAHAGAVMAPTGDVLREFIARTMLGMPLF